MAEIKNKAVTVESLSVLHEHNKDTYMTKVDPTGSGTMTFDGDASFSQNVIIGSNVKLVSTDGKLEFIFLD